VKQRKNLLTILALAFGFVMVEGSGHDAAADYCRRGYKMYKSKNGKNWCCPPGTKGYYDGYTRIRCRRPGSLSTNTLPLHFRYTKRHDHGKWYKYAIRLSSPGLASRIRSIEYQRQDNSFAEYKKGQYLRRTSRPGFLVWWKGYSHVPIAIRVHFNDGTTRYHRITRRPILSSSTKRSSCRAGYKGYVAKSGRVLCCPPATKGYYRGRDDIVCKQVSTGVAGANCPTGYRGYKARSGRIMCCQPGTVGYLRGQNEVICKASARKTTTSGSNGSNGASHEKHDCKPGWGLYLARSGKKVCCPPGKTGKLRGYSHVVCK